MLRAPPRELGYRPKYVYWGGGTPSMLDPKEITRLGATLRSAFDLSEVLSIRLNRP